MRIAIILLVFVFCGISDGFSQVPVNIKDTTAFMRSFEMNKSVYIGKKISAVIDVFLEMKIPIRFFEIAVTSPWIDPKGKTYVDRIVFSYSDASDMTNPARVSRGIDMLYVEVEKPYMDSQVFYEKYLMEGWNAPTQEKVMYLKYENQFVIKDIYFLKTGYYN